ncbi:allophanate hydrolase subunit 1 [Streptomyces thermolineatus]|uniref:Allophanate hydrolase subunit 1 n=1 Tax=Streptomyces thermolineatus TaxID=44033 RepID=A0ABN3M696_9ACTN
MRVLPVGEHALLLEADTGEEAAAWHAELLRRREAGTLPPVREIVPAARTVLLDGLDGPAAVRRLAAGLAGLRPPTAPGPARAAVEIPVRYDGPDLAEVARTWGVAPGEVAAVHSAVEFRVAFCGFAPGFGYLAGLPERYGVPRRATPRTSVPAGAVALAGTWTGVYPRPSPGGWQLIGTTDTVLWDTARTPAALLSPGVRVRFVPVVPVAPEQAG